MEYEVYRVIADYDTEMPDIDGIYQWSLEEFFNDIYSSKTAAIRKAQKLASKHKCYVRVIAATISEKGMKSGKVIYRKH